MNKIALLELLVDGENSRTEFKRDDCRPEDVAKEFAALLNLAGGYVLFGVEDDGKVSGLTRPVGEAEEWVMNIARNNLQPSTIPVWTSLRMDDGKVVAVVELSSMSPEKPYKAKSGKEWVTFVRAGTTVRKASREEEGRLYQAAGLVRYEIKSVPDMGLENLDLDRLESYFRHVLRRSTPKRSDLEGWKRLLFNSDILVGERKAGCASVAGLLLFGDRPNRRLPQAGVTAWAFSGLDKALDTLDEERVRGPIVPLVATKRKVLEGGVIDRTLDFVRRNMGSAAWLDGGRRVRKPTYPIPAVREAVVNALVHRDYTREGTDIEVSLYADRLEVISPGRLPNGVTVDKMREGVVRVARNELLKEILRDYRYVEHQGLGVRDRIIDAMHRHNGTQPDLIAEDHRFTVRLHKAPLTAQTSLQHHTLQTP